MTQQRYAIKQVDFDRTSTNYLKWFVVGYGIHPSRPQYVDEKGKWHNSIKADWLPDGGDYFSTRNEAEMALAASCSLDALEDRIKHGTINKRVT